jgi:hypothetical protein
MCKTFFTIKALRLESAIPQHLHHLSVFLPVLTEDELPLVVVVFILSTTTILTTLSLVLIQKANVKNTPDRCQVRAGERRQTGCNGSY